MKKYILSWIACITASVVSVVTVGAQTNVASNLAANVVAGTNAAAQTAARTATKTDGSYLGLIIWGAVIAAIFAFMWYKGHLASIRNYIEETQEELKKCSWPSREELKGSTVVVMITIALMGLFTVSVDWVFSNIIRLIT